MLSVVVVFAVGLFAGACFAVLYESWSDYRSVFLARVCDCGRDMEYVGFVGDFEFWYCPVCDVSDGLPDALVAERAGASVRYDVIEPTRPKAEKG